MNTQNYENSQVAYEKLNAFFLNTGRSNIKSFGGHTVIGDLVSGQPVRYDVFVEIEKAWVDPEFDFGNTFGYRSQKWSTLVNNYIDQDSLDTFINKVHEKEKKRAQNYNLSMAFVNNHNHGKNCLLSLTATKRATQEKPIISFTLRSSEITKRLLMDLLLVQRVGEKVYGEDADFKLQMFAINMYQDPEAFCMLDSVIPIKSMLDSDRKNRTNYQKKILKILRRLKTINVDDVKYKVHKRCVRQLQRPEGIPLSGDRPMLAKELVL